VKVLIISAWRRRCVGDQRARGLPPLTAAHLAGLCPRHVDVRIRHEQAEPVVPEQEDADFVAITGHTSSAGRMYELADAFRARGAAVVLGGPHVSLLPDEALGRADAIAVGEADRTFPAMIRDFEARRLQRVYREPAPLSLAGLPTPRYDLYEDSFPVRCYVQATRGCPFRCSFCTLTALDSGFRTRPVAEVIRDIQSCEGTSWLQRKLVWFWDDNLTGNRAYARELLAALRPLRKWWWSQCSIDMARDRDLLRLAAQSGCIGVFVGIETFSEADLLRIRKRQNRAAEYRQAIRAFHDHGISVHAGIIVGLDGDTPASIRRIPELAAQLGVDLPFLNILTPFPGTGLYAELERDGRLHHAPWDDHNAVNATFEPRGMSATELETLYWDTRRELYSARRALPRVLRGVRRLRPGALLLSSWVNALCTVTNTLDPDRPLPAAERGARIPLTGVAT
jgi:radical SAM superfamily enzyme YgiQ (UPF0313 family)